MGSLTHRLGNTAGTHCSQLTYSHIRDMGGSVSANISNIVHVTVDPGFPANPVIPAGPDSPCREGKYKECSSLEESELFQSNHNRNQLYWQSTLYNWLGSSLTLVKDAFRLASARFQAGFTFARRQTPVSRWLNTPVQSRLDTCKQSDSGLQARWMPRQAFFCLSESKITYCLINRHSNGP